MFSSVPRTLLTQSRSLIKRLKSTQYWSPKKVHLGNDTENPFRLRLSGEILFGHHPIQAALYSNKRKLFRLFVSKHYNDEDILQIADHKGIEIYHVDEKVLDYLCQKRVHQGVCLDASEITREQFELDETSNFIVYLHKVHDPMNMGAILRSCAYFGVHKVLLTDRHSCRLSPVVSRASAGAMETVQIQFVSDPVQCFQNLKENNWTILGTDMGTDKCTNLVDYSPVNRTVLCLGNEGSGLPDELLNLCDKTLSIQSIGHSIILDSLNVGVATGILLYHMTHHLIMK